MAMLNFKKGLYSALPKTIKEGTVYVVTDEKAMYVDISSTERIRLGQIVTVDTVEAWEGLKPPFSHEAFYYIVEDNALMRNNGTETNPIWTQINSVSDVETAVAKAQKAAEDAQATADAASTAAATAQATADTKITLEQAKAEIDSRGYAVATEVASTYATKAELSAEKNNILGEANYAGTVKGAYEAAAAAATAAEGAQATADTKTTMAEVEAKGYATQEHVNNNFATKLAVSNEITAAKSAILGQTDGADFVGTVKGAYAAADAASTLASGKTTMAEVEAKGYATQTYVNNSVDVAKTAMSAEIDEDVAAAKSAILGKNDEGNADFVGTVKGAYAAADAASTLASSKTTMAEVEAKGYAVATTVSTDIAAAKSAILGQTDGADFTGTVKEAYAKAEAAQSAVNDLSTVVDTVSGVANAASTAAATAQATADTKITLAEAKAEIDGRGYAVATTVANTYATKENVQADIAAAKSAILGKNDDNTGDFVGTVKGAYAVADAASVAAGTAQSTADSAVATNTLQQTSIDDHEERIDVLEEALGLSDGTTGTSLTSRVVDLEAAIDDPTAGLDAAHSRIDGLETELTTNYAKSSDVATAISTAIAENDAMVYRGIVNTETLPDGILHVAENEGEEDDDQRVKIGYTYKVSADGYYGGNLCYVGDLLIANSSTGKEDKNGYIDANNLIWDHIQSGYEDDYLPKLSASSNKGIMLTSATAEANTGDLGSIALNSLNENLIVNVTSNAINFALEWGNFTD